MVGVQVDCRVRVHKTPRLGEVSRGRAVTACIGRNVRCRDAMDETTLITVVR